MLLKMFRILFSAFVLFLLAPQVQAGNGLWTEGKDRPSERVNVNLKRLSPDAFMKVSEKVSDAVVNISTTKIIKTPGRSFQFRIPDQRRDQNQPRSPFEDFFGEDFFDRFFRGGPSPFPRGNQTQRSLGSGFILNSQGFIVTNNHVVSSADEIKVVFSDETELPAKIIGRDPKTDVALLKVNTKKKLKNVIFGNSAQMKVGQVVIAIGNPFGLSHSVTQGIISAKERSIGFGPYDNFIQTDASINPGNSGGPLLNLHGEVIGINTAIVATGQGIGFAIPINLAKDILLKLKKDGRVVRGWLGVLIQKVTDEHATAFKLKKKRGALVADVVKGSPAEKAGLKAGDVIVRFDRKLIKDWHELPLVVANTKVGKKVKVQVIRDGKQRVITVKIARLEDSEEDLAKRGEAKADMLGLKVQELNKELARSLGVDEDLKGVVVVDVEEDSAAFSKGVRHGDVIVEVNRKRITDRKSYRTAIKGLRKGDNVLLLLKRGKSTIYIAFTL